MGFLFLLIVDVFCTLLILVITWTEYFVVHSKIIMYYTRFLWRIITQSTSILLSRCKMRSFICFLTIIGYVKLCKFMLETASCSDTFLVFVLNTLHCMILLWESILCWLHIFLISEQKLLSQLIFQSLDVDFYFFYEITKVCWSFDRLLKHLLFVLCPK